MSLTIQDLEKIGASLYVCEGTRARIDNRGHKNLSVEFTNKDPRTIKLFLDFLRKVIKVEEVRVKAQLFIYPDHDEEKLIHFWSGLTDIPLFRFTKTIKLKQKNIRYKPNPLGTLKIRYHHKRHFLVIQDIIDRIFGPDNSRRGTQAAYGARLENV